MCSLRVGEHLIFTDEANSWIGMPALCSAHSAYDALSQSAATSAEKLEKVVNPPSTPPPQRVWLRPRGFEWMFSMTFVGGAKLDRDLGIEHADLLFIQLCK